jgi:uncharacterized lipoprotein YmbA
MRTVPIILAAVTALALLAGCGRSPAVNFYRLAPVARSEASTLIPSAPTVAVVSVTLPELVNRPQLVLSDGGARVAILETERWAEPLKSAIPRVLAENIAGLIGSARVAAYPQSAANNADYRLFVDIQRFETTEHAVAVDAFWTIRSAQEGKPVAGHLKILEPFASQGYDLLVAAYSRALASLSREIALSLRAAQTKD